MSLEIVTYCVGLNLFTSIFKSRYDQSGLKNFIGNISALNNKSNSSKPIKKIKPSCLCSTNIRLKQK